MSPDRVSWLNMVAAWVAACAGCFSALAAAVAGVFACLAWKTSQGQLKELKEGAKAEKKRIATEHVAAVITDLTTGDVAATRDAVTSFAQYAAKPDPPNAPMDSPNVMRAENLADVRSPDTPEIRHAIFMELWALHRASTVAEDLKHVDESIKKILTHHVRQMVDTLDLLGEHLTDSERAVFAQSADAAQTGVLGLQHVLGALWDDTDAKPLDSLQAKAQGRKNPELAAAASWMLAEDGRRTLPR